MRRELGSKSDMCRPEISCYPRAVFPLFCENFGFNDLLTYILLSNTVERSHYRSRLEFDKYSVGEPERGGGHASVIRVHGRYALAAGTNAGAQRVYFRDMAGDASVGRHFQPSPIQASRGCDELTTEPRAFNLASCCTCAPAMLAKPRF